MYSENLSTVQDSQLIGTSMFEKRTVVELTENEMTEVEGGTSTLCVLTIVLAIHALMRS
jgi:hypothetical protein